MQELRKLLPTKLGSPGAAKSVNYLLHNGIQHQFSFFPYVQLVSISEKKPQKLLFGYISRIYRQSYLQNM
ncbi:hypothetical protein H5410_047280 [Solanum commersonii]|uniref:Uncharacterized protein n=1 Tax=Solanum commersonii TaxID=4109 RepID=A0A9J5XI64_SOLCO|nr:hypothetical protein H5410_047280 [Solanum commersonii]